MNRFLSLLFIAMFFFNTASSQQAPQKPFSLSGELSADMPPVEWVYLTYSVNGDRKMDSTKPKKGKYLFAGQLPEPVLARLRVKYEEKAALAPSPKRDQASVFLQPSKISVTSTDSFSNVKVTGSAAHDAYRELELSMSPETKKMEELNKEYSHFYRSKNEEEMKKLIPKFDELELQMREKYKEYLSKKPESPIAMYVMNQFAGYNIDADVAGPVFLKLPAATRKLPSGKLFEEKLETARKTGVGRMAMDFTQNDTLGKPVSLSSFKGRYVLLDFWASWCGPCRQENPNVVNAFNKYKDKGFHVLGISLDQANGKEKWMKAIHDDQLWWSHVSDLKFWNNAVAVQYGIQSIPQNFLLDPEGKIIAKNLRGEDLHKKLESIFSN